MARKIGHRSLLSRVITWSVTLIITISFSPSQSLGQTSPCCLSLLPEIKLCNIRRSEKQKRISLPPNWNDRQTCGPSHSRDTWAGGGLEQGDAQIVNLLKSEREYYHGTTICLTYIHQRMLFDWLHSPQRVHGSTSPRSVLPGFEDLRESDPKIPNPRVNRVRLC